MLVGDGDCSSVETDHCKIEPIQQNAANLLEWWWENWGHGPECSHFIRIVVGTLYLVQKIHPHSGLNPNCEMLPIYLNCGGDNVLSANRYPRKMCPHSRTQSIYWNGGGDPCTLLKPHGRIQSIYLYCGGDTLGSICARRWWQIRFTMRFLSHLMMTISFNFNLLSHIGCMAPLMSLSSK